MVAVLGAARSRALAIVGHEARCSTISTCGRRSASQARARAERPSSRAPPSERHLSPARADFRTKYSGVRAKDLKDAISLGEARLSPRRAALAPARSVTTLASPQCQCEVAALLKDKVLCGHALSNDLKVRESDRARRANVATRWNRPQVLLSRTPPRFGTPRRRTAHANVEERPVRQHSAAPLSGRA